MRFETFPTTSAPVVDLKPSLAVSGNVINEAVLYWYDEDATPSATYRWGPNTSASLGAATVTPSLQLKPWLGYWVKTKQSCTMVFYPNPRDPASSAVLNQAPRYLSAAHSAGVTSEEWTLQIAATSATGSDIQNYIGVRKSGEYRVSDAPAAPGGVSLSVRKYGEAGKFALAFLDAPPMFPVSWLSGAIEPQWEIESHSSIGGEVTILADNIGSVPAGVPLRMLDRATGEVTDLRAASHYTYSSAPGETRRFTLSAGASGFPSSSASTGIKYPSACLLTKIFYNSSGRRLDPFRSARDWLLHSALGRGLVSLYYDF